MPHTYSTITTNTCLKPKYSQHLFKKVVSLPLSFLFCPVCNTIGFTFTLTELLWTSPVSHVCLGQVYAIIRKASVLFKSQCVTKLSLPLLHYLLQYFMSVLPYWLSNVSPCSYPVPPLSKPSSNHHNIYFPKIGCSPRHPAFKSLHNSTKPFQFIDTPFPIRSVDQNTIPHHYPASFFCLFEAQALLLCQSSQLLQLKATLLCSETPLDL